MQYHNYVKIVLLFIILFLPTCLYVQPVGDTSNGINTNLQYVSKTLKERLKKRLRRRYFQFSKCCLDLLLLNDSHTSEWWNYYELMFGFSNSNQAWKLFYENKLVIQSCYQNEEWYAVSINNWERIAKLAREQNDSILILENLTLNAIYLEITERRFDESESIWRSIISALSSDQSDYLNYYYSAINNLANLKQNQGEFIEAISLYKLGAGIDTSSNSYFQNLHRLYGWIAENYKSLENLDSAYYYQNLRHEVFLKGEKLKNDIAVSELNEKYKAEKYLKEVAQKKLQNNRLVIASISLGGLLVISLVVIIGIRRYSQMKRKTLEQEIIETEQQGLLQAINAELDGAENERKRVATALHDGISSHLSAAAIQMQVLQSDGKKKSEHIAKKVNSLIEMAAEQARKLSHELYPPILIREGLISAIESLAFHYTSSTIEVNVNSEKCKMIFPQEFDSKLYYIINELLQNVMKHSHASKCHIEFVCIGSHLIVAIQDNGVGIQKLNEGLGLQTISARIRSMDGIFTFENHEFGGLHSKIQVPLPEYN